jgi:hypothetical protein
VFDDSASLLECHTAIKEQYDTAGTIQMVGFPTIQRKRTSVFVPPPKIRTDKRKSIADAMKNIKLFQKPNVVREGTLEKRMKIKQYEPRIIQLQVDNHLYYYKPGPVRLRIHEFLNDMSDSTRS